MTAPTQTGPASQQEHGQSDLHRPMRYVDLFAGAGGLSMGLMAAGWHGVLAIEKDPMAFETLRKNMVDSDAPYEHFVDWLDWLPVEPHDIKALLASETMRANIKLLRGTVDLVAGGPPCQGFSIGGARRGYDPRNELVFDFVDFVSLVEPPLVLFENVEGFDLPFRSSPTDTAETRSIAEVVVDEFESMGYTIGKVVLKAEDHGVPQTRRRVLLFGIRDAGEIDRLSDLADALLLEMGLQQRSILGLDIDGPTTAWQALHDLAGTETATTPDSPKFRSPVYLPAESEYATLMRRGLTDGDTPDSHRLNQHGERVRSLYEKAHLTQQPGRLPRDFLLSQGTKSRKKYLIDPDRPVTTLTSHPDEFIHHVHARNVTLREMARLQSFPDDFKFYGRYTLNGDRRGLDVSRCAQIGNAVPPLAAASIGRVLAKLLAVVRGEDDEDLCVSYGAHLPAQQMKLAVG